MPMRRPTGSPLLSTLATSTRQSLLLTAFVLAPFGNSMRRICIILWFGFFLLGSIAMMFLPLKLRLVDTSSPVRVVSCEFFDDIWV